MVVRVIDQSLIFCIGSILIVDIVYPLSFDNCIVCPSD